MLGFNDMSKGRREIEKAVEEMKERDGGREGEGAMKGKWMKVKKQKK